MTYAKKYDPNDKLIFERIPSEVLEETILPEDLLVSYTTNYNEKFENGAVTFISSFSFAPKYSPETIKRWLKQCAAWEKADPKDHHAAIRCEYLSRKINRLEKENAKLKETLKKINREIKEYEEESYEEN